MKVTVALALTAHATLAYVAPTSKKEAKFAATKEDMAALAEANPDFLGQSLGLWDPLGCLNLDFWTLGNEATIGYLRHAEIKHGRVAMAAFLGYLAQSTPVVSGPHAKLPYSGYEPGLTPPEQWDAIPLAGKIQIFGIIGMLESYGEILPQHYCNGGLPGYYPPIKGNRFELIFNLYDPFNWFDENKDKIRGRQVEINNGRLAMLGIFSIISESKVPGSVPLITGLIPEYKGDYMVFSSVIDIKFVTRGDNLPFRFLLKPTSLFSHRNTRTTSRLGLDAPRAQLLQDYLGDWSG